MTNTTPYRPTPIMSNTNTQIKTNSTIDKPISVQDQTDRLG